MTYFEFGAIESAGMRDTPFERWAKTVERELGYSLDGDQDSDGHSIDGALDHFEQGWTVMQYVDDVRAIRTIQSL